MAGWLHLLLLLALWLRWLLLWRPAHLLYLLRWLLRLARLQHLHMHQVRRLWACLMRRLLFASLHANSACRWKK